MVDALLEPVVFDLGTAGRWVGYAAVLLTVGAITFTWMTRTARGGPIVAVADVLRQRAASLGLAACWALLIAAALRGWAQAAAFADPDPVTEALLRSVLLESVWGRGWLAQLLAAVLGAGGFALLRQSRGMGALVLATADVVLLAVAHPLTGHALSGRFAPTADVALHALHLLAAGAWLGTLVVLVVDGLSLVRAFEGAEGRLLFRALVERFSGLALGGAGAAAIAGGVMGYAYVGSVGALVGSTYGRVLLAKVWLLGGVAVLGWRNWRRLTPRLGDPDGAEQLGRSALLELGLGLLVLLATAMLVNLSAPGLEVEAP